eukprot:TRINITY_DN1735_c0_g1_i1.p2 TRINITY_DN1735_c0_g1~~TRINITY_DN1735_c0_g1_i1.p2  ORF type:complete len:187 (-),score=59.86 TRINITY_DN1735_c0_g1_i1:104-664(-)
MTSWGEEFDKQQAAPAAAAAAGAAVASSVKLVARKPKTKCGTLKDVAPHDFVMAYAKYLKKAGKVELPKWVDLVKTGISKELAPSDPDWYYIRAAAVARRIYLRNGTGVGALRKIYGTKKNNGCMPGHFTIASGSVLRSVVQQLEALKVVEKDPSGHGRRISSSGRRDLDRIASQLLKTPVAVAAQ